MHQKRVECICLFCSDIICERALEVIVRSTYVKNIEIEIIYRTDSLSCRVLCATYLLPFLETAVPTNHVNRQCVDKRFFHISQIIKHSNAAEKISRQTFAI